MWRLTLTVCQLLLFLSVSAQTVNEAWVRRYDIFNNGSDQARALAVDSVGNVYVAGSVIAADGSNDMFTIKYSPAGDTLWARQYHTANDLARDIVLDPFGNAWVTGSAAGDFTTIKYTPDGDTLWARKYNGNLSGIDEARAVAVDGAGYGYVCGTVNVTANPNTPDIATIKYKPDGDTAWVRIFDANDRYDGGAAITVDDEGYVYVTGQSNSIDATGMITIKYSPDGDIQWNRRYVAPGAVEGKAIAVDADKNVYVTDSYTLRYDPSGNLVWQMSFGVNSTGAMVIDDNFVYVSGRSGGSYRTVKYSKDNGEVKWDRSFDPPGDLLPVPSAMAVDDFGNVYITGLGAERNYLTICYGYTGILRWNISYTGPGGFTHEARDIGLDGLGNVYVTGTSSGADGKWDIATIKYGQPGIPGECWEVDDFEGLAEGSLDRQNGWETVPGRADAHIVDNPHGPGQVLKLDAGPDETVIMGKNTDDQTYGIHSIRLNVLVDGQPNPAEPSLAKIEIRTTDNYLGWDKKFQLYFGAHMRLNYGPSRQDALIFLPEGELVFRKWYEVEAVLNLATNKVDVFLDGQQKLNNISVGPGRIADISISAWDRPGLVYFDNMAFCRFGQPSPGSCGGASYFTSSDEGWEVNNFANGPIWYSAGGNPGGYIAAENTANPYPWYYLAPDKFEGDISAAYGSTLSFDLWQSDTIYPVTTWVDVRLIPGGGGAELVYKIPETNYPKPWWKTYSVWLHEQGGWHKTSATGDVPTQEEMLHALSNLQGLLIRGQYSAADDAVSGLDNVILCGGPPGAALPRPVNYFIVNDEGDGDGRPEAGEVIGLAVVLQNSGVEKAIDISGILSATDTNITLLANQSAWPDIDAGGNASSRDTFEFQVSPALPEGRLVTFFLDITGMPGGPWRGTFDLMIHPENLAPVVASPIPDTSMVVGDTLLIRNLHATPSVFEDPDQDLEALGYSVSSGHPGKVIATIDTGYWLQLIALDTGQVIITLTADDHRGGMVQDDFSVTVSPLSPVRTADHGAYRLFPVYPNPFAGATAITFEVPVPSQVKVSVLDQTGREVKTLANGHFASGRHILHWDGGKHSSGIYFIRMQAGDFVAVRKAALGR